MKKYNIISLALILGLLSAPFAIADVNNLIQLDLKRTSNESVDVTLVTSENYGDNVLVRKKSDNKYVILVPKVHSAGYKASNLMGVNDLVSNIDVKTVNDTSGGYTKVTLITTKPLDIRTKTTKSAPQSAEQQEYNTIMAQANAVRNNIGKQLPPQIREQKTEVTVNKAPVEKNVTKTETKTDTKAQTQAEIKVQNTLASKKQEIKPEIKLTEVNPEKIEKQIRKEHLDMLKNEIKQEEKALETVPDVVPSTPEPIVNHEVRDITEMPQIPEEKVSILSVLGSKFKSVAHKIPKKMPKKAGITIAALMLAAFISRSLRRRNVEEQMEDLSIDNLQNLPHTEAFGNLTGHNSGLSWKEKYKMYSNPVSRADNKGNYAFIKTPSKAAIRKKRTELEKLVEQDSYSIIENIEPEIIETEDSSIAKTIKFKAFENNRTSSLKMTDRNRITSRFKKYEVERPLHEQNTIALDDTPLSVSKRSLSDANLKVEDVDSRRIKYDNKNYIMSSVDEYLSILDNEQKEAEQSSNTYAATNPIAKPDKSAYFKGSIVKSGFKIDQEKGIYLVNKDGKNALVGKVNDKVFVLKNFDRNITNPIQVRHDNANVYMVKADGFKSLVEVDNDKMGVLIEL